MVDERSSYPVQFSVDYPDEGLDRFSSFLRILFVIPIAIVLSLVPAGGLGTYTGIVFAGGVVFVPLVLMILFRQKYPRWWYDWNFNVMSFNNRVTAYLFLLRDEYPSTDEEQAVHLEIPYPDVERDLTRWLPLFKFWLLAIPHYIVLFFLFIALVVVVIIAWFAILFTGRYPRGLFDFVVGTMRWGNRVGAYSFALVTDKYPPFRFDP